MDNGGPGEVRQLLVAMLQPSSLKGGITTDMVWLAKYVVEYEVRELLDESCGDGGKYYPKWTAQSPAKGTKR